MTARSLRAVCLLALLGAPIAHPARGGDVGACPFAGAHEGDDTKALLQTRSRPRALRADGAGGTEGAAAEGGDFTLDDLGPLKQLLGTWKGRRGLNVISVPSRPEDNTGPVTFEMPTANYSETLEFRPILGGVLNRGYEDANQLDPAYQLDQTLLGVTYLQEIHQFFPPEEGKPPKLIHVENGQWLLNKEPGVADWTVGRMSLIPHGVSLIALGTAANVSGREVHAEMLALNATTSTLPENLGAAEATKFDSFDPFNPARSTPWFPIFSPIERPLGDLVSQGDLQYMKAVKLKVSTMAPGSSLGMLPNPKVQVKSTDFNSTYFIETWRYPNCTERKQLQYVQEVMLSFDSLSTFEKPCGGIEHPPLECLVHWPHVMVNTLAKVKDWEPSGSGGHPTFGATIR